MEDNKVSLLDNMNKSPMKDIGFADVLVSQEEIREINDLYKLYKIDRVLSIISMLLMIGAFGAWVFFGDITITTISNITVGLKDIMYLTISLTLASGLVSMNVRKKYDNIVDAKLREGATSISISPRNMVKYGDKKFIVITDETILNDLSQGKLDMVSLENTESMLAITFTVGSHQRGMRLKPYIDKNTFKIEVGISQEEYETYSKQCLNGDMDIK